MGRAGDVGVGLFQISRMREIALGASDPFEATDLEA